MAENKCCGCCCLTWLSGFFAMPAIIHLIRIIGGWEVAFRGNLVAMKTSWVVFIVAGVLSAVLGLIGCRRHRKSHESAACG